MEANPWVVERRERKRRLQHTKERKDFAETAIRRDCARPVTGIYQEEATTPEGSDLISLSLTPALLLPPGIQPKKGARICQEGQGYPQDLSSELGK
jgi:hypothetical protein